MRVAILATWMALLETLPACAFGRFEFADQMARGCVAKTLDDAEKLQLLARFGLTAKEFCQCLAENAAASLTTDELRFLDTHNGELPSSVRDRPVPAIRACLSLHDAR